MNRLRPNKASVDRLTVSIAKSDRELYQWLREQALAKEVTLSSLVAQIVDDYKRRCADG